MHAQAPIRPNERRAAARHAPRRSGRGEWKGAIAQAGLSEYSFGAAGEEIFYGQATTTTPRLARQHAARARERDRGAVNQAPAVVYYMT
jgi:hypothetical protein